MAATALPPIEPELLDEAVSLCRAAGQVTLHWFRSLDLAVDHKDDGTPVTDADKAAERHLRAELAERHPDDTVLGEEEPDSAGSSGRTWIIDPIDGTKAFARGVPLYSNLLAVYDEHGPAVGVINLPALGETVYAGRGLGCFADGRRITVSDRPSLGGSALCTSGFGPWSDEAVLAVRRSDAVLRTWGDGYGFALVAAGRVEAMVDPAVALWDVAPVPVIIREAGGTFTDRTGNPDVRLDPAATLSAVASNGLVHEQVLGLVGHTP
jgi:histidinol-phosphatase